MEDKTGDTFEVTRTYLQLLDRDEVRSIGSGELPSGVQFISHCSPSVYRYLYTEVGRAYYWSSKLGWSDDEISEHLSRPDTLLGVMNVQKSPAGFFELRRHEDGSVEIIYLGLLPEFIGRGFGKLLLAEAVARAWSGGANRVWLHTCTLDNPAALPNYLRRGFKVYKQETYQTKSPRS